MGCYHKQIERVYEVVHIKKDVTLNAMPNYYQIKQTVQFPEQTAVSKEQSKNALFDILQEEVSDNKAYCQELINKILKLPYAKLPDFFLHHCNFVEASIKWLNKFEKLISENEEMFVSRTMRDRMMKYYTIIERKRKELEIIRNRHPRQKPPMQYINAECEERYFSFKEVKSKVKGMADYTEKIMFLTNEMFDYQQASIDFINPKLPDYSDQCQKEIDQIQHLIRLTDEFSKQQMRKNAKGIPFNKLKINFNINRLVDIFYQLHREFFVNGKPIIDGNINDLVAVVVNSFVDKNGQKLSPEIIEKLDELVKRISAKNKPKKDTFLDNQEFLLLMKISKRTAQTWRDEGRISFSQVGNKIYYKLSDVKKLLNEHYNKAFSKK